MTMTAKASRLMHLFPNGQVERAAAWRHDRKPHYRWVNAYSEATGPNSYSNPLTRADWLSIAQRDGMKCKFHDTAEAAYAAKATGE